MKKKFTIFILFISLTLIHFGSKAQNSTQNPQYFYVLAPQLNVENYEAIHHKIKQDGRFEISSACIPSHVMKIKVINSGMQTSSVVTNQTTFKELISNTGVGNVTTPTAYTEEMFMDACRAARTGN
jgi:hypothetical protein